MSGFHHGVNLGGWLSQCECRKEQGHYESFIKREDLDRIADWGFDHVRLPVDSWVLCAEDGTIHPEILRKIDQCLEWCQLLSLGMQLDMHGLPGYNIATPSINSLFDREEQQEKSCSLWQKLATHYLGVGAELRFELLNEPEWQQPYAVQRFFHRLIDRIREVDRRRSLIISGNHYDHVDYLSEIRVPADPHVLCTFHYYEPNLFTNQLYGVARGEVDAYAAELDYPGNFPGLSDYLDAHPEMAETNAKYCWISNDHSLMARNLQKATDFRKYTGCEIYLGEFGVCYHADPAKRCAWTEDLLRICQEERIDWCYWTYKEMDYGLVNEENQLISVELLETLQRYF